MPSRALQTVPGCHHHILAGILHLSFRTRHNRTERSSGAGLVRLRLIAVQCAVHPAMIVAFKLQDAGATGVRARQPMHQLHRLTAAGSESKALGTRHQRLDALRYRDLQLMLCPVAERLLDLGGGDGPPWRDGCSRESSVPRRADSRCIHCHPHPTMRPLSVFEEERNRGPGPEWAADSSRQRPARTFQHLTGSLPIERQVELS